LKAPFNSSTADCAHEKIWLLQTAAGDEQAFRRLFDAWRHRIYSFALHLTENRTSADEIVQEVFLRVWLHRQKLPDVIYFQAWLYSIARHQVFDALKAQAKERSMMTSMAGSSYCNSVEEHMTSKEYTHLLLEAVNRLPERQQQIYHLSRDNGIRHEEIAGRLQISRHTVKTHLVLALRSIRKYLHYHSDGVLVYVLIWNFMKLF